MAQTLDVNKIFKTFLDFVPVSLLLIDEKSNILAANKKAIEILKQNGKKIIYLPFWRLFPQSEKAKLKKFIARSLRSHKQESEIFERRISSDTSQYLEVGIVSLKTFTADTLFFLILQDVTKRIIAERNHKLAEEIQHELNRRIIHILESITDAFFALDHRWHFTYVNKQAERLLQKSREELFGNNIWKVLPKAAHLVFYKHFHEAVEQQIPIELEEFYPPLNKWFDIHAYPARDGLSVYINDITDYKQNEMQREAFIGAASHELKTPLANIKVFAQILEKYFRKQKDKKRALYLSKIDEQVNKLTKLINDLLDVSKIRSGKLEFLDEVFDFDTLVKETIEDFQRTTKKHKIILKGRSKEKVVADRSRISQVLENLLSNATRYSPYSNKVIVNVFSDKFNIGVRVQDFGIGIPAEGRHKIFESFYQISSNIREASRGLGIGLYLSTEIINYHDGRIWVESNLGSGSIFSFTIPINRKRKS